MGRGPAAAVMVRIQSHLGTGLTDGQTGAGTRKGYTHWRFAWERHLTRHQTDRQTHLRLAHTHRVWWGQSTIVGRLGASDARPATSTPGCRTPQATAGNRQHVCPSRQHGSFALLSESQGPAKQQPSVSWLPGPRAELPGYVCVCYVCCRAVRRLDVSGAGDAPGLA